MKYIFSRRDLKRFGQLRASKVIVFEVGKGFERVELAK